MNKKIYGGLYHMGYERMANLANHTFNLLSGLVKHSYKNRLNDDASSLLIRISAAEGLVNSKLLTVQEISDLMIQLEDEITDLLISSENDRD